ncbi:glucosamine-6-phosphate deaminase [Paratissierella segnis]|jgi:glucosamine-6-phosphate deaminase|uniref:Glucosamine-6-phosphate deaminase n=1 Tax=Paratissierella segnis TaxID=2763679 RepID=A0A926EZT0_9FIRM|nr:glucosamine-6-phosphate deaminase [Paratissierella segnis]MBC8589417.1 glucosamine-6-phosphate deaminase [Paratissierella segnis]
MKVLIKKNYDELSKQASEIIAEVVKQSPDAILGLATGSTPIGTYKELIRMHKEEDLDFSKIKTFNLDEYVGLGGDNPNSYRYFMDHELFDHINIKKENTNVPDGKTKDLLDFCKNYDKRIEEAGGLDLQLLGIGSNGHIAFNEPDEELSVNTSIVKLTEETIKSNARFFNSMEEVPKEALSMGIGSILKAKRIILLASGKGKQEAVKKLLMSDKVSTYLPASFLLLHPDVTIIADEDAYSLMK